MSFAVQRWPPGPPLPLPVPLLDRIVPHSPVSLARPGSSAAFSGAAPQPAREPDRHSGGSHRAFRSNGVSSSISGNRCGNRICILCTSMSTTHRFHRRLATRLSGDDSHAVSFLLGPVESLYPRFRICCSPPPGRAAGLARARWPCLDRCVNSWASSLLRLGTRGVASSAKDDMLPDGVSLRIHCLRRRRWRLSSAPAPD